MKKSKKDEKTKPEVPAEKAGRRQFLKRGGATAGGVLMTTLAAGSIAKGAQGQAEQHRLLHGDDFHRLLNQALSDPAFQNDIRTHGFKALEARGYQLQVPQDVVTSFDSVLLVEEEKPNCGICGICGLCGLCAEVNAGSASAALWALFALA